MIKSFLRSFFDSDLKISILLFVIAMIAYWEISLLQFSVNYDMLDVVLPWRFHVGECLRNNIFPFWNPYQSTGYPIHADLQCPTFYPETIIVGSLFGYTNITLHILFIVYIFLAGLGMYRLLKHFGAINFAAFITGAAFMLSGVFVSHAQHFFAIIGFTWIPWVLLYYLRMSEDPWQFRHILPLSVFSFLMISGGYQALSIIMAYLLATLFIFFVVRYLLRKNRKELVRLIYSNLTWLGILLLFSTVILVSTWNVYDFIERLSGLTPEQALSNPFTPRALVSMVAPFGAVRDQEFLQTDLSMANMYVGVIIPIFFITGLFRKRPGVTYVLLIFGSLAMLAAFGDFLPVRRFLFYYFPMMNLFRLPAYFRFFMVVPIFIFAGMALSDLLKDPEKTRKLFVLSFFIVGMGVLAVFSWSAAQISDNQFVLMDSTLSLVEKLQQAPIYEIILFNCLFVLILLIVFFLLYYYKAMNIRILFSTFIILEMIIAIQMNITYTGCSSDWHPLKIRSQLKMYPKGFPVPLPDKIGQNTDKAYTFQPLWRNVNIYNKSVSFDCFTSFKFKGYKFLEDSVPALKDAILQNHLLYLSDRLYPESQLDGGPGTPISPQSLYLPDDVFASLDRSVIRSDSADRVSVTGFTPTRITASVMTHHPQIFTLLQSNYKGWQVLVDGERRPHFTSNTLYISFLLEEGVHQVEFHYRNNAVIAAFVVSYFTLLFVLYLIAWLWIKTRYNGRRLPLYIIGSSVILVIIVFKLISINRERRPERSYQKMIAKAMEWERNQPGQTSFVFAVDNPPAFNQALIESGADFTYDLFRHATPKNMTAMWDSMGSRQGQYLFYSGINTYKRHEIWPLFMEKYPGTVTHSSKPATDLFILSKQELQDSVWFYEEGIDFETPDTNWFGYDRNLDSTFAFSGVVSNKLDSAEHYSHTLILKASDIPLFNPVFHLSAAVYPEADCEAYLVLEVLRKEETIGYYTQEIHEAVAQKNKWSKVFYSSGTNLRLHPDDEIRAYIWNDSKANLWVDDISVRIGESIY